MIDLRLGDCLEVMPSIPDGSIDLILADLPYGTTACKWDTIIPLEPLWAQYKRIIKRNGAIVLELPFNRNELKVAVSRLLKLPARSQPSANPQRLAQA